MRSRTSWLRALVAVELLLCLAVFAARADAGFLAIGDFATVRSRFGFFGPRVGDTFSISAGTFDDFVADTPADPQIGSALDPYGYRMSGRVVDLGGRRIQFEGSYEIFYNRDANNTRDACDLRVSAGTLEADAFIVPLLNLGGFRGDLFQSQGPEELWLPDLSYGGNPIHWTGCYVGIPFFPRGAAMKAALRQDAHIVPEPGTAALLAIGLATCCGWLARRRTNFSFAPIRARTRSGRAHCRRAFL